MYITQSNFNAMTQQIATEHVDIDELLDNYQVIINFLSIPEQCRLTAVKYIAKNRPEDLKNKIIFSLIDRHDTQRYVIPERQPAYHIDNKCDAARSKYYNLLIPKAIHELNEKQKQEFRQDFLKKQELLNQLKQDPIKNKEQIDELERLIIASSIKMDKDLEIDNYRSFFPAYINEENIVQARGCAQSVRSYYLDKYQIDLPESAILQEIKSDNSGLMDFSLEIMVGEICRILNQLEKSSETDDKQIFQMRYLPPKQIEYLTKTKPYHKKAVSFAHKKQELIDNLIKHLLIIHDFDENNVSEGLLKALGFVMCQNCQMSKRQNLTCDK